MKNSGKCVGTIVAGGEMGLNSQSVEREYQIITIGICPVSTNRFRLPSLTMLARNKADGRVAL